MAVRDQDNYDQTYPRSGSRQPVPTNTTPQPTGSQPNGGAPEDSKPIDFGNSIGQYTGSKYFGAYDETKFNDFAHDSPKYQVLRTLSHFDPSKGVTDEVLAALNSLNLGTFSRNGGSNGTGDKVALTNGVAGWDGMTGADLITDFGGKNQWGVGGEFPGAQKNGTTTAAMMAAARPIATGAPAPTTSGTPNGLYNTDGVTIVQEGGEGDPFAGIGGGVKLSSGGWVPKNSPLVAQIRASSNTTGTAGGGTTASGNPVPTMQDVLAKLFEQSKQSLNVNPNDPIIKAQTDAFNATQDRNRKQYQNEAAESLAAKGLGTSGALVNENRIANENAANADSQFQAQLIGRELQTRRDEIQHALDSMGSLLTEKDKESLQMELAKMDDAIKRQQLAQQNSQYYAGLNNADKHFYDQLAQQARLANADDAYRNAALAQNQGQFEDQLGFNYGDRSAYWDYMNRNPGGGA